MGSVGGSGDPEGRSTDLMGGGGSGAGGTSGTSKIREAKTVSREMQHQRDLQRLTLFTI